MRPNINIMKKPMKMKKKKGGGFGSTAIVAAIIMVIATIKSVERPAWKRCAQLRYLLCCSGVNPLTSDDISHRFH